MSRASVRPYLIRKDEDGQYRITVRTTRQNSQGYPLVTATLLEESFVTATAAKLHLRDRFRAEAGEIATK